jgi:hypothetical protein
MDWMRTYTIDVFDNPKVFSDKDAMAKWHTNDMVYVNADGAKYEGYETVWHALQQIYAPFAAGFYHEPRFWSCWETDNGEWEMIGDATMYADLPAGSGGSKEHADLSGKKWDLGLVGMFHFHYVKDADGPDGFKLRSAQVFSDTFPAVQEMMKRGLIKQ